jgi:ABC-type protease/lipase transport system fused ATPase/permease subunit
MTNNTPPTYRSVMIHASAVEYRGKALVFLGPSETGKSTISQLLAGTLEGARVYWGEKPYYLVLDAPDTQ